MSCGPFFVLRTGVKPGHSRQHWLRLLFFIVSATHSALGVEPSIDRLKHSPASHSPQQIIEVRGVVTALSGWNNSFFLQDETSAISVNRDDQTPVEPGDQVLVRGTLEAGLFAPLIHSSSVSITGKANLPAPAMPSYDDLVDGHLDSTWIQISGVVHSAEITTIWGRSILLLNVDVPGGFISVHILNYGDINLKSLVDSTVTLRGVCGTKFNDRKQIVGLRLFVSGSGNLQIDEAAPADSQIPRLKISQAQRYAPGLRVSHRVKMAGTVTYQSRDHGLYLQANEDSIHVQTPHPEAFQVGQRVEAVGFVQTFGYSAGLRDADLKILEGGSPVPPISVNPTGIITNFGGFPVTRYDGLLVQVPATVVEQLPGSRNQLWLLRSGNTFFQAELSAASISGPSSFEPQSEVKVTGICVAEMDDGGTPTSFRILLRSPADIAVANSPHWEQSFLFLLFSFVMLFGASLIIWLFEHRFAGYAIGDMARGETRKTRLKFETVATWLSVLVFSFELLSLVVPSAGHYSFNNLSGSATTRLALVVASLAVFWHQRRMQWRSLGSAVCSSMLAGAGAWALWHYRTRSASLEPDTSLRMLNDAGVTVAVALSFCLLGTSLLLLRSRKSCVPGQMLALAVAGLSSLTIVTHLYGASTSHGIARHTAMPLLVAVCLFALSMATLFLRAHSGLMIPISAAGQGGLISRRLIPAILVISVLLGWLRLQGQLLGFYDSLFGLSLLALSNCFSFACIIWVSSSVLNRMDAARLEVEAALRERENQLELLFEASGIGDYVWDISKDEVQAHPVVWQLYGEQSPQRKVSGDWFRARQHPDDCAWAEQAVLKAIDTRSAIDLELRILQPDGSYRWIACRGKIICDDAGQPVKIHGINIDVTDRKESEEALRKLMEAAQEAERQFRTGLEFSKVATWRWLSTPDEISWTGPVEEVFGVPPADLSSYISYRDLMHPDDVAQLDAALAICLKQGTEFRAEIRFLPPDGRTRWIAGRGGVLKNEKGQIYGLTGVNFDITSTKVAEQRLQQSERRFRELADAMPQIVWVANESGEIEYYNQRWYSYTGSTIGEDISCFIHPDDLENATALWRQSLATAVPFNCERRLKGADGSFRWHISRALPILDPNSGLVWRWFGTSTDIDDYKCAQAEIQSLNADLEKRVTELAEKEAHYRLLFEGVKDYAIFMLDSEGQVKTWNTGAEQLTGYTTTEIVGKHFSTFHGADSIAAGQPKLSLAYAVDNGRFHQEGWRTRKDGKLFWASVVITTLLDSDGRLLGFCKILRDMTEQRRAMSLLVTERQRAELANQAKSTFLASMSHEIRTPMNAILGMAYLLSRTPLNETQKEYVERFQRAGSNLLRIINDILDLSRIESGNFDLEEVPFDLEEIAQRSIELIAHRAYRNHVNLAARLVPGLSTNITGDPTRFQQILLNLLGNAVKFTERGEILLTIRPHPDQVANHVLLQVSDTGIGIPKDKLASIFDDFTQAESSTTRRFGGTGLGLGIAERLVKKMGGTLTVESEQGVGSTFTFDAFFHPAQESLPAGTQSADPCEQLDNLRVLIVDGHKTNRMVCSEICSACGMRTSETESGVEAVALVAKSIHDSDPFFAVIFDRNINDLNALDALQQIRALSSAVAVIFTTAEDIPGNATKTKAAGFSGYITRPIRRSRLLEVISSCLTQAAPLPLVQQTEADQPIQKIANNGSKIKLLVADDSEDNQFLIDEYLKDTPFEPHFTGDGEMAIKLFKEQQFDLILMDVQMPKLDGLQATAAIRALERAVGRNPIPIIALTANAMAEDVAKSKSAGCNAHLAKPISKVVLMKALEQWQPALTDQKKG